MNIYLYSKNHRCRISWVSPSNDFALLCGKLIQEQLLHKISDSYVLLTASDRTNKIITEYCQENEQSSKLNSRKILAFVSKLSEDECFFILNADVSVDYERLSAIQTLNNAYDLCNRDWFINEAYKHLLSYAETRRKYKMYASES